MSKQPQPKPVQPVVQPPKDVTLAAFTKRELDTLRKTCRDSDDETAARALAAGLARAGK
jgi:hypothetical protein